MGASCKQIIITRALVVDALVPHSRSRAAFSARATCLLFVRLTIACNAFEFFQLDEGGNIWGMDEFTVRVCGDSASCSGEGVCHDTSIDNVFLGCECIESCYYAGKGAGR